MPLSESEEDAQPSICDGAIYNMLTILTLPNASRWIEPTMSNTTQTAIS